MLMRVTSVLIVVCLLLLCSTSTIAKKLNERIKISSHNVNDDLDVSDDLDVNNDLDDSTPDATDAKDADDFDEDHEMKRPKLAKLPLNRWPVISSHDAGTGYLREAKPIKIPQVNNLNDLGNSVKNFGNDVFNFFKKITQGRNPIEDFIQDVKDWAEGGFGYGKTQDVDIRGQLNCGARAFDWRPHWDGQRLRFSHGPIIVDHSMEDALQEAIDWAGANKDDKEDALVLLLVDNCDGSDKCVENALAAFKRRGVPTFSGKQCDDVLKWNLEDAMKNSKLQNGGHLVGLFNCPKTDVHGNMYNPELACNRMKDNELQKSYTQKVDDMIFHTNGDIRKIAEILLSAGHEITMLQWQQVDKCTDSNEPMNRLHEFNEKLLRIDPPKQPGRLYSFMGNFANTGASILIAASRAKTLLDESRDSRLNIDYLPKWLDPVSGFKNVNMVGMDNVCQGGKEVYQVLKRRLPATWP